MSRNSRKHQKQKERRNAKRKHKRREIARRASVGTAERFERYASAPILHCWIHEEIWDRGIGNVIVSRELADGNVAVGSFLIDIFCLGAKDAFAKVLSRSEYDEVIVDRLQSVSIEMAPACARKFVEGAVAYARESGIQPHPDYRKAAPIFGDVDPNDCSEVFEYGKDGKPLFVAGPYDSPERCRRIVNLLSNRLGEEGFHFVIPAHQIDESDSFPSGWIRSIDDEDFEDDDI